MKEPEVRMLLAQISAYDNRNVTDAVIVLWHDLFQGYTYDELKWAFQRHVLYSTEYLMPAHLVGIITQKRSEWAMMNPSNPGPSDAWLGWEREIEAAGLKIQAHAEERRAKGIRTAAEAIEAITEEEIAEFYDKAEQEN